MTKKRISDFLKSCTTSDEKLIIENNLRESIDVLKTEFKFDLLKDITAIDHKEKGVELLYRMYSTENEEEVLLSIIVKDEAESISKIFDSATADEKEIYDLMGIKFIGNDELKRLYMPEGWEGHPLKKDYENKDSRLNWNE